MEVTSCGIMRIVCLDLHLRTQSARAGIRLHLPPNVIHGPSAWPSGQRALQVLFLSYCNCKTTQPLQLPERADNMAGFKRLRGSPALPAKKEGQSTTTTKSSKKKASSTSSKLLELPPEVRDKIFRYALVSNEPIKLQFSSRWWPSRRRRFTMIPGLITASKQLRSETQRIFFEENTFEITPEVMKQRSAAPLILLRTMHHNLGLELRSVSICQQITVRIQKCLFRLKGGFTISVDAEEVFTIAKQDYSGSYIGRSLPIAPHLGDCGCSIVKFLRLQNNLFQGWDIVQLLLKLKDHNKYRLRSYHLRDLIRRDEVVYESGYCRDCRGQGWCMVAF